MADRVHTDFCLQQHCSWHRKPTRGGSSVKKWKFWQASRTQARGVAAVVVQNTLATSHDSDDRWHWSPPCYFLIHPMLQTINSAPSVAPLKTCLYFAFLRSTLSTSRVRQGLLLPQSHLPNGCALCCFLAPVNIGELIFLRLRAFAFVRCCPRERSEHDECSEGTTQDWQSSGANGMPGLTDGIFRYFCLPMPIVAKRWRCSKPICRSACERCPASHVLGSALQELQSLYTGCRGGKCDETLLSRCLGRRRLR